MTHTRYVWYVLLFTIFLPNLLHAQVRGEEKVVFEIGCPEAKYEILPKALTPHLNNFTRKELGVCERVKLWLELDSGTKKKGIWTIKQGTGKLIQDPNDEYIWNYEAPLDEDNVILEARPNKSSCTSSLVSFKIIKPNAIVFEKKCGYHTLNQYDVGLKTKQVSLMPDNVSFAYLSIKELESFAKGTGILSFATGKPHGASGIWVNCIIVPFLGLGKVEDKKGTLINLASLDDAAMEIEFTGPVQNPIGTITYVIPWVYAKSEDTTQERTIQKVAQQGILNITELSMKKSTEDHKVSLSTPGNGKIDCN